MAEVAKNKKRGLGTGGGSKMVTENFMRQFRDSDSLELKKLSAAQFMEVWEHYDSDGKNISSWTHPEKKLNWRKQGLPKNIFAKMNPILVTYFQGTVAFSPRTTPGEYTIRVAESPLYFL